MSPASGGFKNNRQLLDNTQFKNTDFFLRLPNKLQSLSTVKIFSKSLTKKVGLNISMF